MTSKTHSISFDPKTWEVANKLAKGNTRGNVSQLLTRLVHLAALMPGDLGLTGTDGQQPPSINSQMADILSDIEEKTDEEPQKDE